MARSVPARRDWEGEVAFGRSSHGGEFGSMRRLVLESRDAQHEKEVSPLSVCTIALA